MLQELNELLMAAKGVESTGDFEELPEGAYKAYIYSVEFTTSKAGNFMLKWEFILDGNENFNGQHHWKYSMLNSPENMKRAITELGKFGIDCSSIEKMQEDFDKMLDVPVEIVIKKTVSKKNGQEYTNTSVKPV